jgi:hypothetical protein
MLVMAGLVPATHMRRRDEMGCRAPEPHSHAPRPWIDQLGDDRGINLEGKGGNLAFCGAQS